jgi:hypothetical protein
MHSAPPVFKVGITSILGLRRTNYYVLAALTTSAALIEHFQRLANSRRIAEENFQLPPTLPTLLQLDLREQLVRIRSL